MVNEDKERDDHNYNDYFKTEKQQREAESTYQKYMYVDLKLLMNNPYKQTSSWREVQCIWWKHKFNSLLQGMAYQSCTSHFLKIFFTLQSGPFWFTKYIKSHKKKHDIKLCETYPNLWWHKWQRYQDNNNRDCESDGDNESDKDSNSDTHRDNKRDRDADSDYNRGNDIDSDRYTDNDRHNDTDSDRHNDTDNHRCNDTDSDRHNDTDSDYNRDSVTDSDYTETAKPTF